MSIEIRTGKLGQDDTSGIDPQKGEVNLSQRVDNLEERAKDVEERFQKLEKGTERNLTFTYIVVSAIGIVFVITSLLISFDYFKYNQDRYEKFIAKIEEVKNVFSTFSTKEETTKIDDKLNVFKDCLKNGGWNKCF